MKLRKGDKIIVLAGKDRGRDGIIERVFPRKNLVLIPELNVYKKHVKKTDKTKGGIIEFAKPLHASKIALQCPECGERARVGYTFAGDKKRRICKKCKKIID